MYFQVMGYNNIITLTMQFLQVTKKMENVPKNYLTWHITAVSVNVHELMDSKRFYHVKHIV